MKRLNEANAIEALLGIMPYITGCHYSKGPSPDENNSEQREVDIILIPDSIDKPRLAVEHTIVEAFRGQKTYVNRSYEIVQQINNSCKGLLPGDRFFGLVLPHILVESLRRKEIGLFLNKIVPLVISMAQTLAIDDYETIEYSSYDMLLMCNGTDPEMNGTIGRLPGSPKNQSELSDQSLWFSIDHGLGKYQKYKHQGFDTVLVLENISGAIHPSMLMDIENDLQKREVISALVDYIVELISNEDRMIVGNIWKQKQLRYNIIPNDRRFRNVNQNWIPYG